MKIVVIEDENSIRNGLAKMLPKLDAEYEVTGTAANGLEGLELILRTRPDLVIMDIQMPEMDGLTMLAKVREQGILCRVVVLTAYSDFSYAKRAIELNIDNYLLKPIKIPELQETLRIIRESLKEEQGEERLQERLLSLEQIFRGCILAELPVDEELNRVTESRYGLDIREPLSIFAVWLGNRYEEWFSEIGKMLEFYMAGVKEYEYCIILSLRYRLVAVIFYHMKNPEKTEQWYESTIVPSICRMVKPYPVFNWIDCEGLAGLPGAFAELEEERMWNLSFPKGTLITRHKIEQMRAVPIKYPFEIEDHIKRSMSEKDQKEIYRALAQFEQMCGRGAYHPNEIRESCVRFCVAVLTLIKTLGKVNGTIPTRVLVGEISRAVTWEEIQSVFMALYESITVDDETGSDVSILVKRAKKIIEECYSQGITLEELAQRLHVSDEYLSTQFKKETGMSFTETVRKYRIDRIKELLLHSSLKLNQIADMVGYSDPKYMSKVFKEEVGMLPAEFRKENL